MVGSGGLHVDSDKVSSVADWAAPGDIKRVQQFIGFVNYYNRFMRGFARVAGPISNLLSSKLEFVCGKP